MIGRALMALVFAAVAITLVAAAGYGVWRLLGWLLSP